MRVRLRRMSICTKLARKSHRMSRCEFIRLKPALESALPKVLDYREVPKGRHNLAQRGTGVPNARRFCACGGKRWEDELCATSETPAGGDTRNQATQNHWTHVRAGLRGS